MREIKARIPDLTFTTKIHQLLVFKTFRKFFICECKVKGWTFSYNGFTELEARRGAAKLAFDYVTKVEMCFEKCVQREGWNEGSATLNFSSRRV